MSTSETWSSSVRACPCGKGSVVRHITTQDNPWSGSDVCYSIECPVCAAEWRAEGNGDLTHRGDTSLADQAFEAFRQASGSVEGLATKLASAYFASFNAPNKKAELAEIQRLGLGEMSYPNYLAARRTGRGPGDVCRPLSNRDWLRGLAAGAGQLPELDDLLAKSDTAEQHWRAARSNVRRY